MRSSLAKILFLVVLLSIWHTQAFAAVCSGTYPPPTDPPPPIDTPGTGVPPASGPATVADDPCSGNCGDPVNTLSGEFHEDLPADLSLGGPLALQFNRYYSSGLARTDRIASFPMGTNWLHNFQWKLNVYSNTIQIITNHGRLISFTNNGGSWQLVGQGDSSFQLIENGVLYLLANPADQLLYTFDSTGKLTTISDGKGNSLTLTHNSSDQLTSVNDGLGRELTFSYTGGKLSRVSDGIRSVDFSYNNTLLTAATDALGNTANYLYDTDGQMLSSQRPAGNTASTQTYDTEGRVILQEDGNGNNLSISYDGYTTTISDASGNSYAHTHTDTGELDQSSDKIGAVTTYDYDAKGRRISVTNPLGGHITYTYHDASGMPASMFTPEGTTLSFSYSQRALGNVILYDLTGITHPDGTTETLTYDTTGNLLSHTDQRGYQTTSTYNGDGQVLTTVNRIGGIFTYTYNTDGTRATKTYPTGVVTTYGYDSRRRINRITHGDGSSVTMTYDVLDRPLTATDENGNTVTYTYDANGNVTSITDELGNQTTITYDDNDNPVTVTNPLGAISYSYTALDEIASIIDANGNTTTYGYDAMGRMTSATDSNDNRWQATFDAEGNMVSTVDPLGNTTTKGHDSMGRVIQETSPLGNSISTSYNDTGKIVSQTDELGKTTTYTRDATGLVTTKTLGDGTSSASYGRNALGQVTTITDPLDNIWRRSYDGMGRRVSKTDPLGSRTSISYNNRNRVSQVTYPGDQGTVTLTYDGNGNLTDKSYSDGTAFNYSYNAKDQLVSSAGLSLGYDAMGRIISSNGITVTRDGVGNLTTMTLAENKGLTYTYDGNNRVTSLTDWLGGTTSFTYNALGRLTTVTRPNGITTTYTLDSDGRLTGLSEGDLSAITLTLDAKGQITAATRSLPEGSSSPAENSRTMLFDAASQVTGNSYDALGRLAGSGNNTFQWDLASRLTASTINSSTVTNTFDGLGQRLTRTTGGATHLYVWNLTLNLPSISIEKLEDTVLRYYIHTPGGRLLYSIDASGATRSFYHFDEMGNTILITDDRGAVVASYSHTPFGELIASTGSLDQPFTWQGKLGVMDEGNGLYYLRQRFYDSQSCRFISRDPVESIDPLTMNPYQYAAGNPLKFVDPMGLEESNWFFDVFIPWLSAPSDDPPPDTSWAMGQETLGELSKVYDHTLDENPEFFEEEEWAETQERLEGREELFDTTAKFVDASTSLVMAGTPAPGSGGASEATTLAHTIVSSEAGTAASGEKGICGTVAGWFTTAYDYYFGD
ncbi:MAG: hypothetical protein KJ950_00920 [Proteobacteria bacterium]|nr:hypothetical protein [Pseudomonadota bacterium]MBU1687864.1 hypothetical protein [Pseudomonadota bacterium]